MSTNQSVKPVTVKRHGNLMIGGCDMSELAQKYGTPLYVIDEETLRQTAREYINAFKDTNTKILYASKALCNLTVSKILYDEGLGFDVVSAGEIFTLLKAGIDLSKVLFNGSNKSKEEIEFALDNNIGRFSVDNFYEAEILNELAKKREITVSILLRITPGIECHTHNYIQTGQIESKFGFDISQLDGIIRLIQNRYTNLNLLGLHAHIGSQIFELQSFADEINILIKLSAEIKEKFGIIFTELNIGGGNGVKYTETDCPPSIEDFASVVKISLEKAVNKYNFKTPMLYIEPGRSIISTSGVTLYSVGGSKQIPNGKKYVSVDGGMADNPRPSLYQAKYYAELVNNKEDADRETVTVVGRYCESGDVLIEDIELPRLEPNDILCVYNTGAYNYSMSSNYNRTKKPSMVLVNNSQSDIIVNRESYDDLLKNECMPDRLRK